MWIRRLFHNLINRENKKLNLYMLKKNSEPDKLLCITLSESEAGRYAHALLQLNHQEHFKAWCKLRDYDPQDVTSWDNYFDICINDDEKQDYVILNVSYKLKDVLAIMRMFGGCVPLGCDFEQPAEHMYAKDKQDILECQLEFERFWREHHKSEIEEAANDIK